MRRPHRAAQVVVVRHHRADVFAHRLRANSPLSRRSQRSPGKRFFWRISFSF
jgi:hypothetical protein